MGAFYVNCCVRGGSQNELLTLLRQDGRYGYVGPDSNGWTAFVTEDLDEQSNSIIAGYGEAITRESNRIAIIFLCHDEDVLQVFLFSGGSRRGKFDSCPAYFYDPGDYDPETETFSKPPPPEEDFKATLHGAEAFAEVFNLDPHAVEALLMPKADEGTIDLHARWANVLGLPSYTVGMGFEYVAEGESETEWTRI